MHILFSRKGGVIQMDNIFNRWLMEADEPPSMDDGGGEDTGPPEMDDPSADADTGGDDGGAPPDMGDDFGSEFGGDEDMGGDDFGGEDEEGGDGSQQLELDEKISAIMNEKLYQRFLAMLNNINSQITMINNNNDVLFSLVSNSNSGSPEDYNEIVSSLKKLDENIHLYLDNKFVHENYSKNILFFNKCLNLLKLLNDSFDEKIQKGIKATN